MLQFLSFKKYFDDYCLRNTSDPKFISKKVKIVVQSDANVKYVGFDIGFGYSKDAHNLLKQYYNDSNRFEVNWGDSSQTIQKVCENNKHNNENMLKCDVWIIDADHRNTGVTKDINAIVYSKEMTT